MLVQGIDGKRRCFGGNSGKEFYGVYHDSEWGVPSWDDKYLFEMLILEGAQAGLSWETILKRREGYRRVFYDFDPFRLSVLQDDDLEKMRQDPSIIRNKLKIYSVRKNAQVFLQIQGEFGTFAQYIWSFTQEKVDQRNPKTLGDIPTSSPEAEFISKDLKKRGMSFVGPTIIYAYLQAIGVVNDHMKGCWKNP